MNPQNNQLPHSVPDNTPLGQQSLPANTVRSQYDGQSNNWSQPELGSPTIISAVPPSTVLLKRLILIGVGTVLVGLVGGIVLYLLMPTRADYNDATKIHDKIVTLNNNLDGDLNSIGSFSERSTTPKRAEIEKEVIAYKELFSELEGHKVLRNSNVNKSYQVLSVRHQEATTYLDDLLSSYDDIITMGTVCAKANSSIFGKSNSVESYMLEYDKVMAPCADAVEKLSNAKDKDISKFAKEYTQKLIQLRVIFEKTAMTAYQKNYQANYAAYNELLTLSHEEEAMAKSFEDKMVEKTKSVNLKDELNDFKHTLESEGEKAFF